MAPRTPITLAVGQFEDLVSRGLRALIEEAASVELVVHDVPADAIGPALEEHPPQVAILNFGSLSSPLAVHQLHSAHPGPRPVLPASRPTASECTQLRT